jgi:hypothetical protein
MADFSTAFAAAIDCQPGPAVLQNKKFYAVLTRFSPQGAEEVEKVLFAAALLDRQLQEELRGFRQRKLKLIHILHANEGDRELLRMLKVLLLERKIDADQELIFQAAVRLALTIPNSWSSKTVNEWSHGRRLTKASEEGEPSKIDVRFQPENIPAFHRLGWLLRQEEAAIVNDGIVLQRALRMVPTDNQLETEIMNVLDRGGGRRRGYVLVSESEGRKISFCPTAQDQRLIMELRDLLADVGLTGVADRSIIRAAVALLELPNDDFVDHARGSVDARSLINKGVRDGEERPSKTIDVWMTSEQRLTLKTSLLRVGVDAADADIFRAAIRCTTSGTELASEIASQKQPHIRELRHQGQRTDPSAATYHNRLRRG